MVRRMGVVLDLQHVSGGFQTEHVEVRRGRHFLSKGPRNVLCRWFRRLRRYTGRFLGIRIRRGRPLVAVPRSWTNTEYTSIRGCN